ncbi:MAG TPA: DUF2852 domain-containing protein [Methylomirabilota bacterium]|nr:DUF2852 domain-containing protein [Methylomirabilota bacterium]
MNRSCTLKPGWTPLSTGLMVLGFIVFWPLGVAMLAYILWGDRMKDAWNEARPNFQRAAREAGFSRPDFMRADVGRTGNAAFDEYRERELKRLEEERASLEKMRNEFDDFLRNLRKAKDQEEFDRFMSNRGNPGA